MNSLGKSNTAFERAGIDLTVELSSGVSLSAQWLTGTNDDTDGTTFGDQPFEYNGFFVQGEATIVTEKLYGMVRYDLVEVEDQWDLNPMVVTNTGGEDSMSRMSVGLRYYLSPGTFVHLEYSKQNNRMGYPAAANGAGRVIDVDSDMFMIMAVIAW